MRGLRATDRIIALRLVWVPACHAPRDRRASPRSDAPQRRADAGMTGGEGGASPFGAVRRARPRASCALQVFEFLWGRRLRCGGCAGCASIYIPRSRGIPRAMPDMENNNLFTKYHVVDEIGVAHDRDDTNAGNISFATSTRELSQEFDRVRQRRSHTFRTHRAQWQQIVSNAGHIRQSPGA